MEDGSRGVHDAWRSIAECEEASLLQAGKPFLNGVGNAARVEHEDLAISLGAVSHKLLNDGDSVGVVALEKEVAAVCSVSDLQHKSTFINKNVL